MEARQKFRFRKGAAFFLLIFLLSPACGQRPGEPVGAPPALPLPEVRLAPFADVGLPPITPVRPALKDAQAVNQASNYKQVMEFLGIRLSETQKRFLRDHKFLLIPKSATRFKGQLSFDGCSPGYPWDEMLGLFDAVCGAGPILERKPENARLVTPDVVLHAIHKYFANSLEYLESTYLAGRLQHFLEGAQAQALQYRAQSGDKLAAHYELLAAQLTVPLILLENAAWPTVAPEEGALKAQEKKADHLDSQENALKLLDKYKNRFSPDMWAKMAAELQAIYAARGVAVSPLYGQYATEGLSLKTDYTQFTPRSHYVKSSLLRGYFRAMMYLGRNSYLLAKPEGITDALLMAHLLASPGADGRTPLEDWQTIMELTGFYTGVPDDVTYPEWRDFLVKTLGTEKFSPLEALNPVVLTKISGRLTELKPPRILADVLWGERVPFLKKAGLQESTKAWRIFGQRFTVDGWILNRLTAGQEKSDVRLPSTPSALFIPAALGDQTARKFVGAWLAKEPAFGPGEAAGFYGRLDETAAALAKIKDPEWFGSLGGAWLKLLKTLTAAYGDGYPLYMQGPIYPVKQLQTFLGSYTELKHDTLLYAKQSYAELGNGEEEGKPPPAPKGFVEPNLDFWQTLIRLVGYTEAGFKKYGLFQGELEEFGRLNLFKAQVNFYTALAIKELKGEPLTEAEYEKLRTENLSYMAQPFDPASILEDKNLRSGLIADIHTDALREQVLYEATGEPYLMLALVGNEGTVRLTTGVAYNHYEFTGDLTRRYTDADWQRLVYENPARLPAKNFWYESLISK
jgi:hypothetical protein